MTKKHYEAIAAIIASTYRNAALYNTNGSERRDTLQVTASRLADYFATDNPKFNRVRFLQACGVEQDKPCPHLVGTAIYENKKLKGIKCHQCGLINKSRNQN